MRELFSTYQQVYADGGVLHISVWKDETGFITNTYYLPADQSYEPKKGYAGDVAFKLNNGRERPLSQVWEEVLWMLEPTK